MTQPDRRTPPSRAARRKPQRSRSAIGAAVVASAAMTAAFAIILTSNGSPDEPTGIPQAGSAPSAALGGPTPAPVPTKLNRKPTVASRAAPPLATNSVDTGRSSPSFKPGQWIAVLDTYELDAGLEAETLARGKAAKLLDAGIPAKAMVARGQYPGLASGNLEPFTGSWIVYLGPARSSEAILSLCSSPRVQQEAGQPACATYEPAVSLGS